MEKFLFPVEINVEIAELQNYFKFSETKSRNLLVPHKVFFCQYVLEMKKKKKK